MSTCQERQTPEGRSAVVRLVAFFPDGQTLAVSSTDNTVWLWNMAIDSPRSMPRGYSSSFEPLAFSLSGMTLASGSTNNSIRLFNVFNGCEEILTDSSRSITSLSFSPDGQILASGSDDQKIKLWDVGTGQERQTLKGHSGSVRSVAFSPDCQTLASDSEDKTIRIWDAKSGTERRAFECEDGFSWEGSYQISVMNNFIAYRGKAVLWLPVDYRGYTCSAIHNRYIAFGYSDGRVFIAGISTSLN